MAKVNVGVKIEENMKRKLEYISNHEALSYPDVVRQALHEYISKFECKHGRIDNALLNQITILGGVK